MLVILLYLSFFNSAIYVLGWEGYGEGTIETGRESKTWVTRKSMPTARAMAGSTVFNSKIYILGGQRYAGDAITVNEAYDPASDSWSLEPNLPIKKRWPYVEAAFGKIYVIGGDQDPRGWVVGTSNDIYDPEKGEWTTGAPIPYKQGGGASCICNNKIYIVGGYTPEYNPHAALDFNQAYDPAKKEWLSSKLGQLAPLPTPRRHLSAVSLNNRIYVIGGETIPGPNQAVPVGTNEMYDPATNTWTTKAPMPTPRIGLSLAVLNNKIYAIGGATYSDGKLIALNTVEEYDPETDSWRSCESMPTPRGWLCTEVVSGTIYAIGGWNGTSVVNVNEAFTPSGQQSVPKTYILHVQSHPIANIEISYSGDYSEIGTTNFDIGPKNSPFVVTLAAPSTYQDYTFNHWELDGVMIDESESLTVKVDDERRERTAIAVYSRLQLDIVSFLVDKKTKTYTIGTEPVKFNVTLHNKLSSDAKCWVRIKLVLPTPDKDKGYTQIIDTDPSAVNVPAQKDISKIISWNIPANCYPGTVIAIAQMFDSNPNEVISPNIVSNKMLLLMLEKYPDISYIEIFGTEDHKLIHAHLQPYAFGTPFEYYYDWVTFWTVVDAVTEFNLIAFIELLKRVPTYLQKAINLASSEPYDLTIFQIYDQVGFAFETAPATLVETTLTEVALYIGWEMAKNKLNLKGGIPRPPLENFIPIPKEFLEQPVPFYSQLHLPLMMNVEWLTPIPNTIERGRTIEIRVRASDPETKEPLDGATVHTIIGPEVGTYTRPTLLLWQVEKGIYSSQYYFSSDCQTGLWTIQVMANVPPKNGKRGFLGLSPVRSIFVGSEISPIDIKTLDIKAEPLTIGKEEYVKITVNCTIGSSQIQSYDVRVAVWEKRSFLWLFDWDNKLREDIGSLKSTTQILSQTYWEYTNIFQIKGDEMGWDLWPIGKHWVVGEHMLYATVSVSWTSPDSTQVRSIGRTSYCVKVTVTGDEQPLNANVIVLTEKGQKLYLNVYDSKGRRVGFDTSSNSTIIEISGAYYNHGTNWTLIILPLNISDFRCLIDGKSAHETIEGYDLTIASIKNGEIKKEMVDGHIEKGKVFEVEVKAEDGGIEIIPKGFIEQRPLNILLITSLIIGATCVAMIVAAINIRRKRKL
jgi:N-acetylneuraminic acid mutarotase